MSTLYKGEINNNNNNVSVTPRHCSSAGRREGSLQKWRITVGVGCENAVSRTVWSSMFEDGQT